MIKQHYKKTAVEMAARYERLARDYFEKPNFQQVLRWNGRAKKTGSGSCANGCCNCWIKN